MLFRSMKPKLKRKHETYQMISLNFLMEFEDRHYLHFLGARSVEPETSIPNEEALQQFKATFLSEFAGLVLETQDTPAAFARMRQGDSYGSWRLAYSEMEDHQRSLSYDPCEEFKRNLQISKSSIFKVYKSSICLTSLSSTLYVSPSTFHSMSLYLCSSVLSLSHCLPGMLMASLFGSDILSVDVPVYTESRCAYIY